MDELAQEPEKYKIYICALQEITWPGEGTITKKELHDFIQWKQEWKA
jgi:hypothetical protein